MNKWQIRRLELRFRVATVVLRVGSWVMSLARAVNTLGMSINNGGVARIEEAIFAGKREEYLDGVYNAQLDYAQLYDAEEHIH